MISARPQSSIEFCQSGFVDIHHHILWGVDDGPKTSEESAAMLELAYRDGTRHIVATSHFDLSGHCPDVTLLSSQVEKLNHLCMERFNGLTLSLGAEILFSEGIRRQLRAGAIPTLAGSDHVLVEFAPSIPCDMLEEAVRHLTSGGYVTVIAHVERYPDLMKDKDFTRLLREKYGARLQVNAETFLTRQPYHLRRFLKHAVKEGLIDFISSDAHNQTRRRTNLTICYAAIAREFNPDTAVRLFITNAAVILHS